MGPLLPSTPAMAVPAWPSYQLATLPAGQLIRFHFSCPEFAYPFFFLMWGWVGRESFSIFEGNLISYSGKVLRGISAICSLFRVTGQGHRRLGGRGAKKGASTCRLGMVGQLASVGRGWGPGGDMGTAGPHGPGQGLALKGGGWSWLPLWSGQVEPRKVS